MYVDDFKMAGKKKALTQCGKKVLVKVVDLGKPTSFFVHVYLGCTQRERRHKHGYCWKLQNHVWIQNLCWSPLWENLAQTCPHDRTKCKVMWRNTWNDMMNWPTKQLNNYAKSQQHELTVANLRKKRWDLSENCQKNRSQIVLKCMYLARLGRPDILWSVSKLARAITKWTRACDKRSARLISYIHHTCEFKLYCHLGSTAQQCRSGLFQDSDFTGELEDSKSTSSGLVCILLFGPKWLPTVFFMRA